MGRDNQDYFKRAGRSGGPPGPLRQFREQLGKQQAELSRERGFPGSRRPPFPTAPPPPEETPTEETAAAPEPPEVPVDRGPPEEERSPEPRQQAGAPASQASFGPPASEEFAEGLRSGIQQTNGGAQPLAPPFTRVVQRFPRLSRAFARIVRAQEGPSRKLAALGDRIESALHGRR